MNRFLELLMTPGQMVLAVYGVLLYELFRLMKVKKCRQ